MPKILHRKKLRKYCWRRFNIIVYLPRLGFKSKPFEFIPAFRHNGAQQHDESSAKYLPSNQKQKKTIKCTVWQYCQDVLSLPIGWNICRRKFSGVLSCAGRKTKYLDSRHTHCNPLQGKYRFFTGNSLCSISTLTCFGSVQGLKGKNFIEIQGNICILYRNIALDIYIHVYVLITGISLLFEKQQHRILEKQGKPCK